MAQFASKHWWHRSKRELLQNLIVFWLPKSQKKIKILDIGAGTGANWLLLKKFGNVSGIEQSQTGVDYCRSLGWKNISKENANTLHFPQKTFDLVTILDVLYHKKIHSDTKVLQKVATLLKQGGHLIVTDCAGPLFFGKHDEVNEARERYTLKEMKQKVEKADLEIVHATYYYFLPYPLFVATRIVQKYNLISIDKAENLPPTLVNFILTYCMKIEAYIATRWKLPTGSSVVVVARKK